MNFKIVKVGTYIITHNWLLFHFHLTIINAFILMKLNYPITKIQFPIEQNQNLSRKFDK